MTENNTKKQKTGEKDTVTSDLEARFHNVVKQLEGALSKSPTIDDSSSSDKSLPIKPTFIKHLPTLSVTNGICTYYVRLCATISGCMYNSQPLDVSQFSNLDQGYDLENVGLIKPPEVLLYDGNGIFEATTPPFSVTVAGTKMILAWRGSHTIMDWVRDFGFYAASSFRWKNVANVVSVQGGYLACVESCMAKHQDFIVEKIREYEVTEILLTGHSLAGGVAQVAHVWFTGTMDPSIDPQPNPWKDLKNEIDLTVKTISFEGPMTTVFTKSHNNELNQKGIDFLIRCGANMCTTCYHMDVVPRMYGHVEFGLSMIENASTNIEGTGIKGSIEKDLVDHFFHTAKVLSIGGKLQQDVKVAMQFQHLGNILYYSSSTSEPKVCIDDPNGILTDDNGKASQLPQFRDIQYIPVKKAVIQEMLYDHMYIIFGPGLCLNWQPWFEKKLK